MIGILIVSHGNLSKALLETAEMIYGPTEKVQAIGLLPAEDVNEFHKKIVRAVQELDDGDGVLSLTDLKGGSPCNQVLQALCEVKFDCVSGANLPMLLETLSGRINMGLNDLKHHCIRVGRDGVVDINLDLLK